MRGFTIAAIPFVLPLFSGVASAGPVNLQDHNYQPLVYSRLGQIEACGIAFGALVTTLSGHPLAVNGSVLNTYWEGKSPALVVKVSVFESGEDTVVPLEVYHAALRVGQMDTSSMTSLEGDDGAVLLYKTWNEDVDFVVNFPNIFPRGAWVSVSLDPDLGDYTFQLPPFGEQDIGTLEEVRQCNLKAIEVLEDSIH